MRPPLTSEQINQAIEMWLDGRSWRALWRIFDCHPRYLQKQAKALGYMSPDVIRRCSVCGKAKPLSLFMRIGARGKEGVMHDCNQCYDYIRDRQRSILPNKPISTEEMKPLQAESIILAQLYLAKVTAKNKATEITNSNIERCEQPRRPSSVK